jgi:hypothetical protein
MSMAEIWIAGLAGAAVAAGATVYASNKASSASKNAANAQTQASQNAIAEQQREFDINQANQQPWLNTGKSALSTLAGLYGLNGGSGQGQTRTLFDGTTATPLNGSPDSSGTAANAPDYSAFFNSPDYQFALQQGQQGVDRDAAARGALYSGGHTADVLKFGQGLASQQFNNYTNRLASLAGVGQTAANELGAYGQNTANSIGNLMTNAGNARASSFLQQGRIAGQTAGALGNAFNQFLGYYQNRPQTQTQSYMPESFSDNYGGGNVANYYNNPGANTGTYDVFGLGSG